MTTWTDFRGITLSEKVGQRKTNTIGSLLQIFKQERDKFTDTKDRLVAVVGRGWGGMGGGEMSERGQKVKRRKLWRGERCQYMKQDQPSVI